MLHQLERLTKLRETDAAQRDWKIWTELGQLQVRRLLLVVHNAQEEFESSEDALNSFDSALSLPGCGFLAAFSKANVLCKLGRESDAHPLFEKVCTIELN